MSFLIFWVLSIICSLLISSCIVTIGVLWDGDGYTAKDIAKLILCPVIPIFDIITGLLMIFTIIDWILEKADRIVVFKERKK